MARTRTPSLAPNTAADDPIDYDCDPIIHIDRKSMLQAANLLFFASAPPLPPHQFINTINTNTTTPFPPSNHSSRTPTTIHSPLTPTNPRPYGPRPSSSSSPPPNPRKPILKAATTSHLPPAWLDAQRDAIAALAAANANSNSSLGARAARTRCALLSRQPAVVRALRRLVPCRRGSPGKGWLCRAHEWLEREVVRGLLRLVKVEVGVRCDVVRAWGEDVKGGGFAGGVRGAVGGGRVGAGAGDGEGDGAGDAEGMARRMGWLVQVLSGVGSLFLGEEEFERYFGDSVRPECQFEKVESGCPACVLAVVGGRQEVLMALRASMKGRAKSREPRLLALVEAWMPLFGWREEREMRAQSDALAEEVREVRQWMHDRKVRRRAERAARGEPEDPSEGRSKHRGRLPSGTEFVDGVPMPNFRMPNRYQKHGGSSGRGVSPTEKKTIRFSLPPDDHQDRDRDIYRAPTAPSNGAVRQESWPSTISSRVPPIITPSSSYASSSLYHRRSSSRSPLTPSTSRPPFPLPSPTAYLTPSTSNPWLYRPTSNPSPFSASSNPSVDAAGYYVAPRMNWYDRDSGEVRGSSHPQHQGRRPTNPRLRRSG